MWNFCNGNLKNRPVPLKKYSALLQPQNENNCGYNSYEVDRCRVLCIAQRRNFTLASTPYSRSVHLFYIREEMELPWLYRLFINTRFITREYYPGFRIPYNFYVIISKPKSLKGFQALIEPFSIDTWVAVLLTCTVLGLLIYGAEGRQEGRRRRVTFLLENFWVLYSVLVLQGSSRLCTFSGKLGVFWIVGCFLLCAIIMTSLYQGELATSMTTIVYPFIPRTLEDIAQSSIPIITAEKTGFESNLEYQIRVAKSLGIYGSRVSANLEKIKDRIFVDSDSGYWTGIKIARTGKFNQRDDQKEFIIKGKDFAVMDAESATRPIVAGILLSPDFIVYKGRENLSFKGDVMWVWPWNFFSKLYKRSWQGLVEGGLDDLFFYLFVLRTARHRKMKLGKHGREHLLRVLYKDNKNKEKEDFSKINQESMLPCYYFFLIMLSVTILIVVVEVCTKFRNRVRPIKQCYIRYLRKCYFVWYSCRKC